ncbi:MAG: sulfate permease [Micropruina sp.]
MNGAPKAPAWARYAPGLQVLLTYDRSWLRGDVLAGVTVAAYLIPQVMAYAEIANLPPVAGLWAIMAPLVIYAVLGTSRQLSIGPESTTALLTAAGVGALIGTAGPDRVAEVSALLAIAVGLVCLGGWVARLGFLANLLSRPVLVGYMAGIAVLMITSQFGKVTGLKVEGDSPIAEVLSLFDQLGSIHVPTAVLAGVVLIALFAFRSYLPLWPGPLLCMLGAAAAAALFGLSGRGITVVGEIPQGLPLPSVPSLGDLGLFALFPFALGIAVVGYSDNVLTGRAFATKRRETLDSTQELLALGVANLANGFFSGFPVSSSGSRTVIGDAMGSRTQLHSLVALSLVVVTLLVLGPVLSAFPTAALGAVVIYAAIRLIDLAELRRIATFRRSELVLALATTIAVLGFGVLVGIGIAVGLSLLDLIRRIAHPHDGVLGYVPGMAGMHDVDDYPEATMVPGLVVYRYDSPLFFANSEDFLTRAVAAAEAAEPDCQWFVLNAEANVEVDLTSVDTLEELRAVLSSRGVTFAMARVKMDLREQLHAAGFVDKLGDDLIFPTLPTAVAGYLAWYRGQHGQLPPGLPDQPAQPTI